MWEAIRYGNMRLRELEEAGISLRRKSARLDEEIAKIKVGFIQMGYAKEPLREPDLAGPPTLLAQAVTLLSWW